MSRNLRASVKGRANSRCEYCRRYMEIDGNMFFEIEHIIPSSRGGPTTLENLAYACRRCNSLKSDSIEAADPSTGQKTRLFNPRLDQWTDHFERSKDLIQIIGISAIGRVTVLRLRLNDTDQQRSREIQRDYLSNLFPLD